jgi:DNA-binding NtrC family response regulator
METTDTAIEERIGASTLRPTLRLVYSGEEGIIRQRASPIATGSTLIGRAPPSAAAGIALPSDHRVSRSHARLRREGRRLHVADEGSKNGIFLNGCRIQEAELADGDVLRVGDSFFVVRMEEGAHAEADVSIPSLVGISPAARTLRRRLAALARETATVLLLGETGTGKEVAARALHDLSGRPGDFIAVNCGALPHDLAESLLFGHIAGAFSGAHRAQLGFFRAAERGTLFLDEIGDLPVPLQPKLLRLLEERAVTPLGATTPVACDVRIVAATNRPLTRAVQLQEFRGDLYARLTEIPLHLVPLRQRREDILPLVAHALGEPAPRLTPRLVAALLCHPWSLNIRDLLKVASQLRIMTPSGEPLDLPAVTERLEAGLLHPRSDAEDATARPALKERHASRNEPEPVRRSPAPSREELEALLVRHRGSISSVARAAGRSRRQIDRWMASMGLAGKDYRG